MYKKAEPTDPGADPQDLLDRIAEFEVKLAEAHAGLPALLVEKAELMPDFEFHLEEGSNAYAMGDKQTWLFHKNQRVEVEKHLKPVKAKIALAKDKAAAVVEQLNPLEDELLKLQGEYFRYSGETLGNAVKTTAFEPGTIEWHEQRARGIGGSDVAAIMGLSPWNSREDIFALKTGQVEAEPTEQGTGALWRGAVWEDRIARRFMAEHDDFALVNCKDSWVSETRSHQFANLDGLLYEPGAEKPSAILEIKTSSTPSSWDDGVPAYYRTQVLWYMDAFGIPKGIVAVLIDDLDYREYEVVPLPREMERIHAEVDAFVAEVEAWKNGSKEERLARESDKIGHLMPSR